MIARPAATSNPAPHVVRRGAGEQLLFIHGNGVDHRLLVVLDEIFERQGGWERIYLDLPGFGQTPRLEGRGGLPDVAEWLDETVGDLVGERPIAVVGNSLGGLLARDLRARRPAQVRALALLAPVVDPDATARNLPPRTVLHADSEFLATLPAAEAEMFADGAIRQTPEAWAQFEAAVLPGLLAADVGALAHLAAHYALAHAPEETAGPFDGPTLIVTGRQDHAVGFEDQAALAERFYPRSTVAVLDDAGHNVHLDQAAVVAALLDGWGRVAARRLSSTAHRHYGHHSR